ncbi:hypothetical protein [Pseudoroseicyclus aestuarii]|uniref:Uncharacterized protein n=1 Tax=Pseudoroseicyclus aestuarii TaxID=1795041 RepID=A0A318SVB3_9RHOB|nr:hypothetical protein [Pseudoroseicyclus aestuarii]PYE85851.1 hypothetical protein DFP88_101524 [Pseudoroseicyclus aestuarii]
MPNNDPSLCDDLSELSVQDWLQRLDDLGEAHGYLEPVGAEDTALLLDAGKTLLVTFETRAGIRAQGGARPRGFELVNRNGWSLLALISEGDGWFRSRAVWGYFDRLIDDGFFEDFDRVLFYGHHVQAYAAAAFSVAAPGARALLLRPLATLEPSVAGWDHRYEDKRRHDFTSRYGFAPDMIEALRQAYVVVDPTCREDDIHAALFRRPNLLRLPARYMGPEMEAGFDRIDMTVPLIEAAMEGSLSRRSFGHMWRARRRLPGYLRRLVDAAETRGHPALAARAARYGLQTEDAAQFRARLAALDGGPPAP